MWNEERGGKNLSSLIDGKSTDISCLVRINEVNFRGGPELW